MDHILLNVRVQVIYYQTPKNELGITHATSEKRISIDEAKDILINRKIEFEEILKVKYEFVELEVPLNNFEDFLITL